MIEKNILIVTPYLPYPIDSGGAQAQFHMINYLRKHIHISIAFSYQYNRNGKAGHEELQKLWPDVDFYPFAMYRPNFIFRKCRQLLRSVNKWPAYEDKNMVHDALAMSFYENFNYKFIGFIGEIINSKHIDLIQIEFPKFQNLTFGFPNIKRLFIQHEIQFIRNERFLNGIDHLSTIDTYQYRMMKFTEIAAMNACSAVVVLTDIDKEILAKEDVKVPIYVSPAVIPVPESPVNEEYCYNNKLVFLGSSDHSPNYEGIMWFLENVWQHILDTKPNTQIQIIGRWRNRFIREINSKYSNVECVGFVESIDPYLKDAIMIVPILIGSGMRMKIIDAANYGVPFITTSVGVEGLDFQNNIDCLIEDDPVLFAQKTITLMDDNSKQEIFRANAFKKVKELLPTDELLNKRLDIYKELLSI